MRKPGELRRLLEHVAALEGVACPLRNAGWKLDAKKLVCVTMPEHANVQREFSLPKDKR